MSLLLLFHGGSIEPSVVPVPFAGGHGAYQPPGQHVRFRVVGVVFVRLTSETQSVLHVLASGLVDWFGASSWWTFAQRVSHLPAMLGGAAATRSHRRWQAQARSATGATGQGRVVRASLGRGQMYATLHSQHRRIPYSDDDELLLLLS